MSCDAILMIQHHAAVIYIKLEAKNEMVLNSLGIYLVTPIPKTPQYSKGHLS